MYRRVRGARWNRATLRAAIGSRAEVVAADHAQAHGSLSAASAPMVQPEASRDGEQQQGTPERQVNNQGVEGGDFSDQREAGETQ